MNANSLIVKRVRSCADDDDVLRESLKLIRVQRI